MAKSLLFYLLLSQGLLTSAYALPLEDCESPGSEGYTSATEKIEVDVAIIGGGSCGINAATWLLDRNKTVVVLEAKNQIGGHAETYHTPTGVPVNLGVAIFTNTTTITNYLSRYNVPLTRFNLTTINAVASTAVDFSTGNIISNAATPSAQQQASALLQYAAQLAKYPEITFGYNLPSPVPEDLLLPFGQFVDKYNLGAMMDSVFRFNQGYVPLLEIPTLYMLKYFGPFQLQSFQQGYFTVSATGDTRTLYDNAAKELGSRVLYSVSDMKVQRPSNGDRVSIMVGNSSTGPKIVYAKKLITAIPPTLQSLQFAGFDLDSSEKSIFGKFFSNAYYSLIIKNSGIQTTLFNRNTANKYGIPNFPAIYTIVPVQGDSELMQIYYASAEPLSDDEVKANVLADINRLPASLRGHSSPEIVSMASHSPFNVMVSPEDIKNGYYSTLDRLQGMKNTWYYGAAIATHSSSTIWEGLDKDFLPRFLATF